MSQVLQRRILVADLQVELCREELRGGNGHDNAVAAKALPLEDAGQVLGLIERDRRARIDAGDGACGIDAPAAPIAPELDRVERAPADVDADRRRT